MMVSRLHPPAGPFHCLLELDEYLVFVRADTAVGAGLAVALSETGTTRVALAARLGIDEKAVRRMLDPRHRSSANRIREAVRALSRELLVEDGAV